MTSRAERFCDRFAGLPRAYGRTVLTGQISDNGKHEAQCETVHEMVTVDVWEAHLANTAHVGIVPINDEGMSRFGAIDIDQYGGFDLDKLAGEVSRKGLPLIVCRTKSGGAHLYTFTSEDTPAATVRAQLGEWAMILGHSGSEIFPKQSKLAGEKDTGNWINMPYAGGDRTHRYAVAEGKTLSPDQFLDLADLMALSPVEFATFVPETETDPELTGEWLDGASPCLVSLGVSGFGEGSRNKGLFNLGVYIRKRFADGWEGKVDEYNQRYMKPPLGHKEVAHIVKSLSRKSYNYTCAEEPIVHVCNRLLCLTKPFGVGGATDDPGVTFGQLVKLKTEPPIWIWDVDGARMELDTTQLKDQSRFQTRCMEVLNKWPFTVKPQTWAKIVREKLASIEVQSVPPDATQEGQLMSHLESYCTLRAVGRLKEDLLLYKPWTDPETGRTYFSAVHFRQYLEQQRMRVTEKQLWSILRKHGAEHTFFKIKGRGMNVWGVPAFAAQDEEFIVPGLEVF